MNQLDFSNFSKLFPFYLEINSELTIINSGPSIEKICGKLNGINIANQFDFVRPKLSISHTFESYLKHSDTVIILELKESKIRFRGQFIFQEKENTIIYINSPWLTDISDLQKNGLLISDFAIHDTVTDNLQLLRSKEITTNDLIKLNHDLKNQQNQLITNNENLKIAEEKYKVLVESSTDIIFRVNTNGNFIYVNPNVTKITGYSEKEIIGQNFDVLLDDRHKTKLSNFYKFQLNEKIENTTIEFPITTKEGKKIWLEQSVNLIKKKGGEFEWIALARDITEKKLAESSLIKSEEKYRSILENLELGLVEADVNNKIVRAYPKFCELVGYTEEEIIGKDGSDLLLDAQAKAVMEEQNSKRQEGKTSVYEIQITKKSGDKVWVIISGAPFYDMNDQFMGTIGVHLDITERKKMEEEFIVAKEVAENSLKSKELFLANMSHEIRTPLNAIIGMSELLLQSELNSSQAKYLNAIQSSSENLLTLINDILNFSKIDSGKIEIEQIPIDIDSVIQNSFDLLFLKAEEKNILLTKEIDNKSNNGYLSDPVRLGEIFTNLLSNAVKFTDRGEIKIKCTIKPINEEYDKLKFEISDTGIGIEKEKLSAIFEEFTQASNSTTRLYGGTGLGLSISKKLVELFGGKLMVSSEIGKGSVFSFEIKLHKTELPILKNTQILVTEHLENAKILVVDDNELNLFLATSILEKWKCTVKTAKNGLEAFEQVKNESFDIIFMDISMPILNGVEASIKIRKELKSSIPIIALTANIRKGDIEKYLQNGMNDYLNKPFKQLEFLNIINKYIKSEKTKPKLGKSGMVTNRNLIDLSRLRESFGENEEFIRKMILVFLEITPELISEIKKANTKNELTTIKSLCHKIKPSLEYLALIEISALARTIEIDLSEVDRMHSQINKFASFLENLVEQLEQHLTK